MYDLLWIFFTNTLQELQECFESGDIPLLQAAIARLPEEEAKYHMKRCVESGLWVPEGGVKKDGEEDEDDEDIYHEACTTPPVSSEGGAAAAVVVSDKPNSTTSTSDDVD